MPDIRAFSLRRCTFGPSICRRTRTVVIRELDLCQQVLFGKDARALDFSAMSFHAVSQDPLLHGVPSHQIIPLVYLVALKAWIHPFSSVYLLS